MITKDKVIRRIQRQIAICKELDSDWISLTVGTGKRILELLDEQPQIVQCKDCKYFEVKDWWGNFDGFPVLATSDCPTCNKWADGCMTNPEGYCFLAEQKRGDAE